MDQLVHKIKTPAVKTGWSFRQAMALPVESGGNADHRHQPSG